MMRIQRISLILVVISFICHCHVIVASFNHQTHHSINDEHSTGGYQVSQTTLSYDDRAYYRWTRDASTYTEDRIKSFSCDGASQIWYIPYGTQYPSEHAILTTQSVQDDQVDFNRRYLIIARVGMIQATNPQTGDAVVLYHDISNTAIVVKSIYNGEVYQYFPYNSNETSVFYINADASRIATPSANSDNQAISVYGMTSASVIYTINMTDTPFRCFTMTHAGHVYAAINNNSVNQYDINGRFVRSHAINITDFSVDAIAVADEGTLGMIDCQRWKVAFQPTNSVVYPSMSTNSLICSSESERTLNCWKSWPFKSLSL